MPGRQPRRAREWTGSGSRKLRGRHPREPTRTNALTCTGVKCTWSEIIPHVIRDEGVVDTTPGTDALSDSSLARELIDPGAGNLGG